MGSLIRIPIEFVGIKNRRSKLVQFDEFTTVCQSAKWGKSITANAQHPNALRVEHAGEGNEIQAKPGSLKSYIYADIAGFCKSATVKEIETHGFVLTPGRYVGAAAVEDDGVPFEDKMKRLVGELNQQFAESAKLEAAIKTNLQGLGFGIKLTEENAHDGP